MFIYEFGFVLCTIIPYWITQKSSIELVEAKNKLSINNQFIKLVN